MLTISDGLACAYFLQFVLGTLGNSLILVTMAKHAEIRSRTNLNLASLALADLALIVYCLPLEICQLYELISSQIICHQIDYLQQTIIIYSILILANLARASNRAREDPVNYMAQISSNCVLLQLAGSLTMLTICLYISLPVLAIGVALNKQLDAQNETPHYQIVGCTRHEHIEYLDTGYLQATLLMLIIMGPFIVYLLYKSRQVYKLAGRSGNMGAVQGAAPTTRSECESNVRVIAFVQTRDLTLWHKLAFEELKMISLIALILALCWSPLLLGNILTALKIQYSLANHALINQIFRLLAYTSSTLKPIVYARMSPDFSYHFERYIKPNLAGQGTSDPDGERGCQVKIIVETTL